MDCSVEIWTAKPVVVSHRRTAVYKVEAKNQKEEPSVVRRCRKDCIGDLGAEESPKQPESRVKCKVENDGKKQKSWWNCSKKTKSPSVLSLTKTASVNCCTCCCVLAAYLKEVCRFLLECPVDSKVSELFADVMKISGCLCSDCFNILKNVFRVLFVIKK